MQENAKKPSVKPRIFSSGVKVLVSEKMGTQQGFIAYVALLLTFRHVSLLGMLLASEILNDVSQCGTCFPSPLLVLGRAAKVNP